MSATSAASSGRAAHRQLMVDACTIARPDAEPSWDPETGQYTELESTPVYAGPCRVKPTARGTREADQGVRDIVVNRYDVALPFDTEAVVEVGDLLTVTASADAWLIGRPMVVSSVGLGTTSTARWLTVDDQRG